MTNHSDFDRAIPSHDRFQKKSEFSEEFSGRPSGKFSGGKARRAESTTFIRISRGKFYLAYEGICEAIVPAEWVAQTIREHRENHGEGCEN